MVNRPEVTIAALWFDTGAFTRSYYTGCGMHFFQICHEYLCSTCHNHFYEYALTFTKKQLFLHSITRMSQPRAIGQFLTFRLVYAGICSLV